MLSIKKEKFKGKIKRNYQHRDLFKVLLCKMKKRQDFSIVMKTDID